MSSKDPDGRDGAPAADPLPYEKPAVAWEEQMDIRPGLTAACGKGGGEPDPCGLDPSS